MFNSARVSCLGQQFLRCRPESRWGRDKSDKQDIKQAQLNQPFWVCSNYPSIPTYTHTHTGASCSASKPAATAYLPMESRAVQLPTPVRLPGSALQRFLQGALGRVPRWDPNCWYLLLSEPERPGWWRQSPGSKDARNCFRWSVCFAPHLFLFFSSVVFQTVKKNLSIC